MDIMFTGYFNKKVRNHYVKGYIVKSAILLNLKRKNTNRVYINQLTNKKISVVISV